MFNWGFTTGTPCTSPASPASLRPPQTPRRRPRCPPCFSLQHAAVPSANTCLKVCTLLGVIIFGDYLRVKGQTIGPKYVWFLVFFRNFNNPGVTSLPDKNWKLPPRGPTIREPAQFPRNPQTAARAARANHQKAKM